jgi:CHRD domain
MASPALTRLVIGALGLAACGGGGRTVEINPQEAMAGSRWHATLATPKQLAGAMQVRGTAWMGLADEDSTRTQASVSIENAVPGGQHPWHVHVGQCGSNGGIFGPADAYQPLDVDGDGKAESTAELPVPVPAFGEYYVNVHASRNNMGTIIACGNLAPPSR